MHITSDCATYMFNGAVQEVGLFMLYVGSSMNYDL